MKYYLIYDDSNSLNDKHDENILYTWLSVNRRQLAAFGAVYHPVIFHISSVWHDGINRDQVDVFRNKYSSNFYAFLNK